MSNWNYNPAEYTANDFSLIPEGDYRVKINNVVEKIFNSGNEGYEITFDVLGSNSKLWYYLVLDYTQPARTNKRLGMFFDSFNISDYDLSHFENWIGKDGAVRVKHNIYNGIKRANVIFCLSRSQQSKFAKPLTNPTNEIPPQTSQNSNQNLSDFVF